MDIDKLEGRELDVAVAEARGWTKRIVSNQPFSDAVFTLYDGPNGECLHLDEQGGPAYDIAAAWGLVHELIRDCSADVYVSNEVWWECLFATPIWKGGHATGPTAPIAICRAYLEAKAG